MWRISWSDILKNDRKKNLKSLIRDKIKDVLNKKLELILEEI
jgi:hypothetical protein